MIQMSTLPFPRSFMVKIPVEPIRAAILQGKMTDFVAADLPTEETVFVGFPCADYAESLQWLVNHSAEVIREARQRMIMPVFLN